MDPTMPGTPRLVPPSLAKLPQYIDALRRGWSPSTTRDVSGEQLDLYRQGPAVLLAELTRQDGTVLQVDGRRLPRLPSRIFWIWDGAFCGAINLRFVPGSEDLPRHVSGHVGYAIVPWKQRRGYATRALALILPVARAAGLARVLVTCDVDNEGSRKVILANGGVPAETLPHEPTKLRFWIDTPP
jgi:predicted acetyltransferase